MKLANLLSVLLATVSVSSIFGASSIHYRGSYTGSGLTYRADLLLDKIPSGSATELSTPKIRLEIVICDENQPFSRRFYDLVALEPLSDRAYFQSLGDSTSHLELAYTSKWNALDGYVFPADELGTRSHLHVERLKSELAICAD